MTLRERFSPKYLLGAAVMALGWGALSPLLPPHEFFSWTTPWAIGAVVTIMIGSDIMDAALRERLRQ